MKVQCPHQANEWDLHSDAPALSWNLNPFVLTCSLASLPHGMHQGSRFWFNTPRRVPSSWTSFSSSWKRNKKTATKFPAANVDLLCPAYIWQKGNVQSESIHYFLWPVSFCLPFWMICHRNPQQDKPELAWKECSLLTCSLFFCWTKFISCRSKSSTSASKHNIANLMTCTKNAKMGWK